MLYVHVHEVYCSAGWNHGTVNLFTYHNHFHLASQTWLLGRLLPLMVGSYVPDEDSHWECYGQLLSIIVLATAMEVTLDSVSELTMLVQCI